MTADPIPATMTALVQHDYGEADALTLEQIAVPVPQRDQVLIRVQAAALNPADVFLMRGHPRAVRLAYGLRRPTMKVRGSDVAGEVVAVGDQVQGWRQGDRVFGEAATGSLGEFACAAANRIGRIPHGVTAANAAASVMAALAARDGLRTGGIVAGQAAGQRMLIIGASGGIGSFAVQMAKAAGAHVTGVCSTRNVETVHALGADAVVDYTREDFTRARQQFDVVLDNVGAVPMAALLELATRTGVVIPNSGMDGPDGGAAMRVVKATLRRALLRRRYRTYLSKPTTGALEQIARDLTAGTITPLIDSTQPLEGGAKAMARVASQHARGKVVVTV